MTEVSLGDLVTCTRSYLQNYHHISVAYFVQRLARNLGGHHALRCGTKILEIGNIYSAIHVK